MERILGYDKNVLKVENSPSLIETFFGDTYHITEYVNIGETYPLTTAIKWINKNTGEDRRCEYFDNYIKAQETISRHK